MISLSKNATVSLAKEAPSLTKLHVGLGWDAVQPEPSKGIFGWAKATKKVEIDLDASLIMVGADKKVIDNVWFRQLKSKDGSAVHSGDNRTGDGDGDDEVITVDLTRVPAAVQHLVFTVNSYSGQTFDEVENATIRLLDAATQKVVCGYELKEKGRNTGFVMATVSRVGNGWEVKALGIPASGTTFHDLLGPALNSL